MAKTAQRRIFRTYLFPLLQTLLWVYTIFLYSEDMLYHHMMHRARVTSMFKNILK